MYNTGSPSDLWWELRRELASRMVPRMTSNSPFRWPRK